MKRVMTLITAVLCLGVVVPGTSSQQPPNPPKQKAETAKAAVSADVPAELQSAFEKLKSAQNDLAHAGGEWGGFREAASKNINEALRNLEKAMEYYAKNKK